MAEIATIGSMESVDLSRIDLTDQTFRITTRTDIEDLLPSIREIGLLSPPILTATPSGADQDFMIVAGFRRIAACRHLGLSWIEARIVESKATSPDGMPSKEQKADAARLKCIQLAIADNAMQRPLNLIEQARSVALLANVRHDQRSLLKTVSQVMGIPANPSLLEKLQRLHRLPSAIQELVLADSIALATALEIGDFEPQIGWAFADYFENLKLSFSNQKEFMTLIREIALRENIPLLNILNDVELKNVLNDPDLNRNQKTQRIRMVLKQRRLPALTQAEKTFEQQLKALKLDNDTRLIPPKYFEGLTYSLVLNFKDMAELKARQKMLEQLIDHPALEKILA